MSSDILIGYTGMISFGHSAFFGLGMYGAAAALLSSNPPNLWLALFYGLIAAAAVAAFVAYFSTRLRDIYFAITTLIFSQIFYVIIFTWTAVTGGENGLNFDQPALGFGRAFSIPFTPTILHWFVLAVVAGSYLLLRRVTQSPFGMVLQSIRENEARTRAIGYPVERYKIVAVMLSGLFAGPRRGALRDAEPVRRARFRVLPRLGRDRDLQRHRRHRHPGRPDRRRRLLSAAARGPIALPDRVLPDPRRTDLHRDGHFRPSRAARLRAALAQRVFGAITGPSGGSSRRRRS